MEILTFLGPLFGKLQDPAVLVPTALSIFLGWLHVVWRREERVDRKEALETLHENTQALNAVKNVLSALTGRAV